MKTESKEIFQDLALGPDVVVHGLCVDGGADGLGSNLNFHEDFVLCPGIPASGRQFGQHLRTFPGNGNQGLRSP